MGAEPPTQTSGPGKPGSASVIRMSSGIGGGNDEPYSSSGNHAHLPSIPSFVGDLYDNGATSHERGDALGIGRALNVALSAEVIGTFAEAVAVTATGSLTALKPHIKSQTRKNTQRPKSVNLSYARHCWGVQCSAALRFASGLDDSQVKHV